MHDYDIEYVPYSRDRLDEIIELMLDTFFTHEPLVRHRPLTLSATSVTDFVCLF